MATMTRAMGGVVWLHYLDDEYRHDFVDESKRKTVPEKDTTETKVAKDGTLVMVQCLPFFVFGRCPSFTRAWCQIIG